MENEKTCVIIGDLQHDSKKIKAVAKIFNTNNITVLSPTDFNPEKQNENEILQKIKIADFIYLVNPNGRVDIPTACHLGLVESGKPVYNMEPIQDSLLNAYFNTVISPRNIVLKQKNPQK